MKKWNSWKFSVTIFPKKILILCKIIIFCCWWQFLTLIGLLKRYNRATLSNLTYDVLLLKLHTEVWNTVAVWLAKHETYTLKIRNKNSFYNKKKKKLIHPFERLTKKNLFGPDVHIYIFFSLGPLFIRDRLKNWVCKLVQHFMHFLIKNLFCAGLCDIR